LGTIDYIAGAGHVDDCTGAQLYLQILANAIGIGFEGLARSYTIADLNCGVDAL
jgi:hypothetical protein